MLNQINPRTLFLIDALGALVSAVMLGIVLTNFEANFGMPTLVLYKLSLLACAFFVFSFSCYFFRFMPWRYYLKTIAFINLSYCLLTLGLVHQYFVNLQFLGLVYFIIEILIIGLLVLLEWKTATDPSVDYH